MSKLTPEEQYWKKNNDEAAAVAYAEANSPEARAAKKAGLKGATQKKTKKTVAKPETGTTGQTSAELENAELGTEGKATPLGQAWKPEDGLIDSDGDGTPDYRQTDEPGTPAALDAALDKAIETAVVTEPAVITLPTPEAAAPAVAEPGGKEKALDN